LDEPGIVKQNVQEYFEEENIVACWLKECMEPYKVPGGRVRVEMEGKLATFSQSYASFKQWAERNNEEHGSAKWFLARMKQLGHMTVPDRANVKYYQFKMKFSAEEDEVL